MLKKGVFWALHTRHLQNGTAPPGILPSPLREFNGRFNYELSKQIVSVAFLRKIIRVNIVQTVRFLNGVGFTR